MIGTTEVKITAARPNLPLPPLFAFKDSPSSLRLTEIPKAIGNWTITAVSLVITYPDNITISKSAVRTGNVWVATVEGTSSTGKVSGGYEILANGKDENNTDVEGYCLGRGDVFILDTTMDIKRLIDKITVRFLNELPTNPVAGDMTEHDGKIQLYDGTNWIDMGGGGYATIEYVNE